MESIYHNINETEQELHLTFSSDEIKPILDRAYREIAPKIHINGFRPGKAPLHLIKKMYGESIENEEFAKLADQHIPEVLKNDKIHLVSTPHLHDLNKKDGGLEIVVHYHHIPSFDLFEYKGLTVDEPQHVVTNDEIDNIVDDFVYFESKTEADDMVIDKNYIVHLKKINSVETTEADTEEKAENQEFPVNLRQKGFAKDFTDKFIEKKVGDKIDFSAAESVSTDESLFEITKIEKLIPNELTEEFIKKMTQDKFSTEDELRTNIELDLQHNWDERSKSVFEDNLINAIISQYEIKIPDFYIKEQAQRMLEADKKQYQNNPYFNPTIESYLKVAENVIKWSLIRDKIADKEDIKVEEEDIIDYVDKYLQPNDQMRQTYVDVIKGNEQLINNILARKVMDFLIDFTTTNTVEFTEEQKTAQLYDSFDEDFDDELDEDDDLFTDDEEFIGDEELEDEFFDDDEFEDGYDEEDFVDDEEDDDTEEDEDFDDDELSKK
ncbi:trigger factor [Candidatus Kapaibacterium sp.]